MLYNLNDLKCQEYQKINCKCFVTRVFVTDKEMKKIGLFDMIVIFFHLMKDFYSEIE